MTHPLLPNRRRSRDRDLRWTLYSQIKSYDLKIIVSQDYSNRREIHRVNY